MKIQRVLCDYYNTTGSVTEATCNYNVSRPIIQNPRNYRLLVETAEVSLTQMPLDMDSNYLVAIGTGDSGELLEVFRLSKVIDSVDSFLLDLNQKLAVQGTNPGQLGMFTIDKDSFLSFIVMQDDAWTNTTVYFNEPLWKILKEFCTPFRMLDRVQDGVHFYAMENFATLGEKTQRSQTISELVKFKSVRFITNLPVRPYMVYNQESDRMSAMNILTTVKVNSANFDLVNQRNLLYIPMEMREIELDSTEEISSFRIGIEIYYATGHTFVHLLAPEEYFEIALTFKEI